MSATHLIRGCPGAGKTRELSLRAARAVEAYGAEQVAIASLTKTAAAEIAGRDTNVPDRNVGTLHAHAFRALECTREEMAETGARLREFAADHPDLATESNYAGDDLDDVTGQGSGIHASVQNLRARLAPPETWTDEERAYHAAWSAWKKRHGLRDFTDLIERCADEPELMAPVRGLFFDESQDFSALELKLALGWARLCKTTVICADVDQAIFEWRGADPAALEALPYGVTIPLLQSYRCSRAVRDLAVSWIDQIPGRAPMPWLPTDVEGSVHQAPMALRDTPDMLEQIDALDGTVMVLTSCGYMLEPLLAALREGGVPFANPHRRKEARWNPTRAVGYRALEHYLRTDTAVWGEDAGPRAWEDLHAWTQCVQAKGYLARGAKAAIEEHCRMDEFGQTRAAQPVPLDVLVGLLGTAMHPALRNDTGWFEEALMSKHAKAGRYAARVHAREAGALRREPRCVVGTVHSVKGASSDNVVICPELSYEGWFGENGWHGNGRDAIVRLFYVAATRARQSVHVLDSAVAEYVPLQEFVDRGRMAA
jgi:superfamily I DNA/RNA helicase